MTQKVTLEKKQLEKILDLLEQAENNLPKSSLLITDYQKQVNDLRKLIKKENKSSFILQSNVLQNNCKYLVSSFNQYSNISYFQLKTNKGNPVKYSLQSVLDNIEFPIFSKKYGENFVKSLMKTMGVFFLYDLFDIEIKFVNVSLDYVNTYIPRDEFDPKYGDPVGNVETFNEIVKLNNFDFINEVLYSSVNIDYDDEVPSEEIIDRLDYEITTFELNSSFDNLINIRGQYTYSDSVPFDLIVNESSTDISCSLFAVNEDDSIPDWQRLLLLSYCFIDAGSKDMALFIAFTSFENYINGALKIIYNNIARKVTSDDLNTYLELEQKYIVGKKNELIKGRLKFLMALTGLEDVRNNSKSFNNDSSKIENILRILKKATDARNDIAHGKLSNNAKKVSFSDFIYSFLTLTSYLGTGADLYQYLPIK